MTTNYRNCEINVTREQSCAGYDMLFFNAFTYDGLELTSGFEDSDDTIQSKIRDMKNVVDDYYKNPSDYEEN